MTGQTCRWTAILTPWGDRGGTAGFSSAMSGFQDHPVRAKPPCGVLLA